MCLFIGLRDKKTRGIYRNIVLATPFWTLFQTYIFENTLNANGNYLFAGFMA